MLTIDPRFISARRWTAETGAHLWSYGTVPALLSDDAWKGWARSVIANPTIAALIPPQPDGFAHWQDWAVRFNICIAALP